MDATKTIERKKSIFADNDRRAEQPGLSGGI